MIFSNIYIGKEIRLQMHWQNPEARFWKDPGILWNIEPMKLWKPSRFSDHSTFIWILGSRGMIYFNLNASLELSFLFLDYELVDEYYLLH